MKTEEQIREQITKLRATFAVGDSFSSAMVAQQLKQLYWVLEDVEGMQELVEAMKEDQK